MSAPDWKDAPDWANWLARDEDGAWYWYEYEPTAQYVRWCAPGRLELVCGGGDGWRETLQSRHVPSRARPETAIMSAPDSEDILSWPDGAWCYRYELEEFGHKSDDYETVPFGSDRHAEFE